MKAFAYTILFVLILVFFYIMYKLFIYRLNFNFKFQDINFSTLNLEDFLQSGQTKAKVLVDAKITNANNIGVRFSDINIWFYNNGNLIAQSANDAPSNFENMYLPANGVFSHTEILDFFVSVYTVEMVKAMINGQSQKIDYAIKGKIFGIPFAYNDFFTT